MNENIKYAVIGAGAAAIAELYAMQMHLEDRHGNHVRICVIGDDVQLISQVLPIRLVDIPLAEIYFPKRRELFQKNDKIHWSGDRKRNFRGRQHQRLIFQRTTHK